VKTIKTLLKRWFVDATGAMALGLMASLVVGVYFQQLSNIKVLSFLAPLVNMASPKSPVIGAAVGVAIAYALKKRPLVIYASAVTGAIGYMAGAGMGGPVGAYVGALVGAEIGGLVAGKTKLDIVLTPFVTILAGGMVGHLAGPGIGAFMLSLGDVINAATLLQPVLMGIVIAAIMSLAITSPISSAALAISLGLSGLAAGAATTGCCCAMIGFAVISFRDNGVEGLIAQTVGTSKVQLPNVLRKPVVWIPTTAAALVLGPLATTLFGMENNPVGAGMGGSGFVGQINTYITMAGSQPGWLIILKIAVIQYILPAAASFAVYAWMRKKSIIRDGDMKFTAQQ